MAPSIIIARTLFLALVTSFAHAATVHYDFNITWVIADPTQTSPRHVIGINGQWPLPPIRCDVGDRVVIKATNSLGDESTSLHFHGLYMNGTTHMDGPVGVSQCPIAPGHTFTYDFVITQPGTYWYHSHSKGQYPDGLRGPLIVTDPDAPFHYDEQVELTLSDWYHEQMATKLIPQFMSKTNPTGAEPVPDAALMNDAASGEVGVRVHPGKTYLFRVVNMGAFASQYFWIEGHHLEIVELDGIYTEPRKAEMLYLSAGQRCSFLLRAKEGVDENFAVVGSMDTTLFDVLPPDLDTNVTGHIVYSLDQPLPPAKPVAEFAPIDDILITPLDKLRRLPPPTKPEHNIQLVVKMDNLRDGRNYAFFNDVTYTPPKVPTLYTVLSAPEGLVKDQRIYGGYTNSFVLDGGSGGSGDVASGGAAAAADGDNVVQITIRNDDDGRHPFHLHGHAFQVLYRSSGEDDDDEDLDAEGQHVKAWKESDLPEIPMRRDTVVVWGNGEVVLRFRADNPGIWLFHCHIEWHVDSGLIATLVESPLEIRKQLGTLPDPSSSSTSDEKSKIPKNHLDACDAIGMPFRGNAAGSTRDFLDLSGEPRQPGPLPKGFTPKGYVALLISTLSGLIGLFTISWYGLAPVSAEPGSVRDDEGRAGGGGDDAAGRASEDSVDSVETVGDDGEQGGAGGGEVQPLLSRAAGEEGLGSGETERGRVRRVR